MVQDTIRHGRFTIIVEQRNYGLNKAKGMDALLSNGTKLRLIKRLLYYSKNSIEVFFSTIFIKQLTSIQKYAAALATDMII